MKKTKRFASFMLCCVLAFVMALSMAVTLSACNKKPVNNNTDTSDASGNGNENDSTDGDKDEEKDNNGSENGSTEGDKDNTGSSEEKYPYSTPSGVKVSADKTELTAGDTFTVKLEISANMPGYNWHSVSLLFTALSDDDTFDNTVTDYFEYVSHTCDTTYYRDSSAWNPPIGKGMLVSLSNMNIKSEQTLATQKLFFEFTLKVKEDAPALQTFHFGVAPIKAFFLRYRNVADAVNVIHRADNVIVVNNKEDEEAGNALTINKIALSIKARAN